MKDFSVSNDSIPVNNSVLKNSVPKKEEQPKFIIDYSKEKNSLKDKIENLKNQLEILKQRNSRGIEDEKSKFNEMNVIESEINLYEQQLHELEQRQNKKSKDFGLA